MKPSTPFFERDDLERALEAGAFDERTRRFVRTLARDGGAPLDLGDGAEGLCDAAVAETDLYFADPGVKRVQDAWLRSPAVRRLANLPAIRDTLRSAYGREPFAFQTLNFKRGSEQHFHSDIVHFSSMPEGFMCGVWIALEDVRPEAGPLAYKRGSHRLPVLTMQDVGVRQGRPTFQDYADRYVPRFDDWLRNSNLPTDTLVISKGQAFVWSANLAHGGMAIADPASTRRSLVIHYYFEGCTYFTPMTSNPLEGALTLRVPPDIRTGLWAWPMRGRRPLPVSLGQLRETLRTRRRGPVIG
jgi:hypothetical protein